MPCDKKGRISDCLGTDTNMTLFDELCGLVWSVDAWEGSAREEYVPH